MSVDYLIKNGLVISGSAAHVLPEKADIAVEGDCIAAIGDLSGISADTTIDARGLVVCPGFIDAHAHSEFLVLADGRAEGKICQGITTEINGNCGMSAAPLTGPAREQREGELDELHIKERWSTFTEYFALLEKRGCAANFSTLAGHGNLRASVAGYEDRPLSKSDMAKVTGLLCDAMEEGAGGLSTGLIYPPGIYSDTPEIIALAQEVKKRGGIYATHMRSEGDALLESVEEVIDIARRSGVDAHISHLKASGEKNWGKTGAVFEKIKEAHEGGLRITCDRYPYTASCTDLDSVLPAWAFEGGNKKELLRLETEQERLSSDIRSSFPGPADWGRVVISSVVTDRNKWMEGRSLLDISLARKEGAVESLFALLREEKLKVGAMFFTMHEDNLTAVLKKPYTMIGTDSAARSFSGITAKGAPHPRGFGSAPRVLGRYVREQGTLTLSEAVYKMTGLPSGVFGLARRGILKKGYFADITVFDPVSVRDTADYNSPFKKPEGIHHVIINGIPVVLDGCPTGALPGRVLRRRANS